MKHIIILRILVFQAPVKENVVFADFAAKEFPRGTTCYHSVQSLNKPLLPLTDQVDQHVMLIIYDLLSLLSSSATCIITIIT